MNKFFSVACVASLALACVCASAGEMSSEERSELKQRADAFQAERARNPDFQPGEGRLNRPSAELRPEATAKKGRAKTAKGTRSTKAAKAAKVQRSGAKPDRKRKRGRSLKDLPGAFVR